MKITRKQFHLGPNVSPLRTVLLSGYEPGTLYWFERIFHTVETAKDYAKQRNWTITL